MYHNIQGCFFQCAIFLPQGLAEGKPHPVEINPAALAPCTVPAEYAGPGGCPAAGGQGAGFNKMHIGSYKRYCRCALTIPDLQDTHYDIKGVTFAKLLNCVRMYREIYDLDNDSEQYIVRYAEREILRLLKDALTAGRVKKDLLPKNIRDVICA